MLKLIIPGEPIAKTRHRCGCRGKYPVAYDPQIKSAMVPTKKWILEWWNRLFDNPDSEDAQEASSFDYDKSFDVIMNFYLPIPRSSSTSEKNRKLWGMERCIDKPDVDNLCKFYFDCMSGIVWPDDKQVSRCLARKIRYSENPRTEIMIMTNKELNMNETEFQVFKHFSPEELKDLLQETHELSQFLGLNEVYLGDNDRIPRQPFFSEASVLLTRFAVKFGDKLKKISKIVETNKATA